MARHDRTLRAVFHEPTLASISWADVESLFRHLGAEITEGRGSRERIFFNGRPHVFHLPHPQKEAGRRTVETVRDILREAGIEP